jgi:hypothetical protein
MDYKEKYIKYKKKYINLKKKGGSNIIDKINDINNKKLEEINLKNDILHRPTFKMR